MVNGRMGRYAPNDHGRAQLLLIGGITVALTLIGIVVILNSTIYTQNVSPGNTIEDANDLETYERTVQADMEQFVIALNESEGHVEKRAFEDSLAFYSARMAEQSANRKPIWIDVTLNSTASETKSRINHVDSSEHLRNRDNDKEWTLLEGTTEFEEFNMMIEAQDAGSNPFTVVVTGSNGDEWSLKASRTPPSGSEIIVEYEDGTTDLCSTGKPAEVDLLAGTVDGTDCFDFAPALDEPYSVEFVNGNHATGTYSIVADGNLDESYFYDADHGDSPYLTEDLQEVVVDMHYETSELSATTPVEVDVEGVVAES